MHRQRGLWKGVQSIKHRNRADLRNKTNFNFKFIRRPDRADSKRNHTHEAAKPQKHSKVHRYFLS